MELLTNDCGLLLQNKAFFPKMKKDDNTFYNHRDCFSEDNSYIFSKEGQLYKTFAATFATTIKPYPDSKECQTQKYILNEWTYKTFNFNKLKASKRRKWQQSYISDCHFLSNNFLLHYSNDFTTAIFNAEPFDASKKNKDKKIYFVNDIPYSLKTLGYADNYQSHTINTNSIFHLWFYGQILDKGITIKDSEMPHLFNFEDKKTNIHAYITYQAQQEYFEKRQLVDINTLNIIAKDDTIDEIFYYKHDTIILVKKNLNDREEYQKYYPFDETDELWKDYCPIKIEIYKCEKNEWEKTKLVLEQTYDFHSIPIEFRPSQYSSLIYDRDNNIVCYKNPIIFQNKEDGDINFLNVLENTAEIWNDWNLYHNYSEAIKKYKEQYPADKNPFVFVSLDDNKIFTSFFNEENKRSHKVNSINLFLNDGDTPDNYIKTYSLFIPPYKDCPKEKIIEEWLVFQKPFISHHDYSELKNLRGEVPLHLLKLFQRWFDRDIHVITFDYSNKTKITSTKKMSSYMNLVFMFHKKHVDQHEYYICSGDNFFSPETWEHFFLPINLKLFSNNYILNTKQFNKEERNKIGFCDYQEYLKDIQKNIPLKNYFQLIHIDISDKNPDINAWKSILLNKIKELSTQNEAYPFWNYWDINLLVLRNPTTKKYLAFDEKTPLYAATRIQHQISLKNETFFMYIAWQDLTKEMKEKLLKHRAFISMARDETKKMVIVMIDFSKEIIYIPSKNPKQKALQYPLNCYGLID